MTDRTEFDIADLDYAGILAALCDERYVLLDPGECLPALAVTTTVRMDIVEGLRRLCSLVLTDLIERANENTMGRLAREALPWCETTPDDEIAEHLRQITEALAGSERPGKSDRAFLALDGWRREAEADVARA